MKMINLQNKIREMNIKIRTGQENSLIFDLKLTYCIFYVTTPSKDDNRHPNCPQWAIDAILLVQVYF
jgi:hypothetical protein